VLTHQTATGVDIRYVQFGKPFKATYEFAEDMLRRHLVDLGEERDRPLNVYMVGGEGRASSVERGA
jgi:ribonucleotide monophosphatase NagD (HAD superfamily)